MNNVFVIIGGNLGNRQQNLAHAIRLIEQKSGVIKKQSSIYETEPWGVQGQPNYYNQVLEILTDFDPESLMQLFLQIEQLMGRVRTEKYSARSIDIDILFFNDQLINTPDLTIPHPRLQERRFVLEPLNEIAPEFVHPELQKTIAALLIDCTDSNVVKKI